MKKTILIFFFLFSTFTFADCEKEYKKFKLITLTDPITMPLRTGLYFSTGALSSSGASLIGTIALNLELTTAGVLYGAAFTYEGTYFIEATLSNFKKFKGRGRAQKLIIEAKIALGDTLDEFVDDVNEALEEYTELSKEVIIKEITEGNSSKFFCQSKETLFTINNIRNHIVGKYIPIDDLDYDDDYDDTIDIIYE
ncbi:hypothetical protein A9Q84_08075 [Halobacteriovorax marinus]|uniref:Lipoprotein n=1 Tax=Halobacteriovorax marinus TaxID=97084 RepID=A0A1Y5F6E6_9BACT|nr:hypothetical protein A9Q84_08075 [Halobacteriovorax marinus]